MTTTPITTQVPVVNRPPATAAARVAPLADLLDSATDLVWTAPGDLGYCEDCMDEAAVAVATLSWPDADETDGRDEITVCRDCLAHQVDFLTHHGDLDTRITVEAPAWLREDVTAALGVPAWQIGWPFLVAETTGYYLADEVDHARRLIALRRRGLSIAAADTLLREHPETARTVERVLAVSA